MPANLSDAHPLTQAEALADRLITLLSEVGGPDVPYHTITTRHGTLLVVLDPGGWSAPANVLTAFASELEHMASDLLALAEDGPLALCV